MAHAGRAELGDSAVDDVVADALDDVGVGVGMPAGRVVGNSAADDSAARARADARAVFQRAAARRLVGRSDGRAGSAGRAGRDSDSDSGPGPRPGPGRDPRSGGAGKAAAAVPAGDAEAEPVEPTRGILLVGPGASFGTQLLARFAREGFVPAVISRSADTVARAAGELAASGVVVHTAVADVTDAAAYPAAIGRLAAEIGGLTVVVYNAKLSIRGTALTVAAQNLNQTLAVNVTGALTTVQAALPLLADRPGASIIFTTAGSRTSDSGGRFALALGKAGLAALGASVGPVASARGVRLRSVAIEARVAPDGPLAAEAVADHFWQAFAAPRGSVFRLTERDPAAERDQLPLDA